VKTIRLFLVLLLMASVLPLSAAAEEKGSEFYYAEDIWDNWAYNEIDDFLTAGIIDGYVKEDEDGYPWVYIYPQANITRAQFTKIIVNALDLKLNGSGQNFSDVKTTDPLYPYIQIASSHGIIKGRDGRFDPNEKINREQIAVMIHRAFKNTIPFKTAGSTFTDVPSGYWAEKEINEAAAQGIINGYGNTFKPRNLATRSQGIVMIHRALRQETSSLPSSESLINAVTAHFNSERQYFSDQNYEGLRAIYNGNGIGYYKAMSTEMVNYIEEMPEYGEELTMEPTENFSVSIESVNNRYASVFVNNLQYIETYYSDGVEQYSNVTDYSGYYSLKKDSSGKWKIYNITW
jgi:S-layer homology domain